MSTLYIGEQKAIMFSDLLGMGRKREEISSIWVK